MERWGDGERERGIMETEMERWREGEWIWRWRDVPRERER